MDKPTDDPLVRSSRREALVVFFLWLGAMTYTVMYCYLNGYGRPPESLSFILGFPDWVFWGILLPWGVCLVLSYWFGYALVRDAPLGKSLDEVDAEQGDRHG